MTVAWPGSPPTIHDYDRDAYRAAISAAEQLLDDLRLAQQRRDTARSTAERHPMSGLTASRLRIDDGNIEQAIQTLNQDLIAHIDELEARMARAESRRHESLRDHQQWETAHRRWRDTQTQ